jgi:hypothetical protein
MSHVELTQTGMPVFGAGAGQMPPQLLQFIGSRVRSLQPSGQLVWPPGQVAQSVPLLLQPFVQFMVAAVHVPFALHIAGSVRTPLLQDWPAPHSVPAPLLPVSTHTDDPVEHDVAPVLQGLVGWQA